MWIVAAKLPVSVARRAKVAVAMQTRTAPMFDQRSHQRPFGITETELATEAGPVTFARGREYALAGRVRLTESRRAYLAAQVTGSAPYATELGRDQAGLVWSCSCPIGHTGELCKHVIALGLTHIAQNGYRTSSGSDPLPARSTAAPPPAPDASPAKLPEDASLESFLRAQSAGTLAEWLLDAARSDVELEGSLLLRMDTATHSSDGADGGDGGLRRAVARVVGIAGYLNYRQSRDFARRLAELDVRLAAALESGPPELVLDALDSGLKRLFKVYARADDTGGNLAVEIRALGALHARAVSAVVPDAKTLGASLFKLGLEDRWEFIRLDDYSILMGTAGWDAYRQALLRAWGASPPGPLMRHGPHANLIAAVEGWYDRVDDLEGWLSVKSRLADDPWVYREVVERLAAAGRGPLAAEWAERALKAFPKDRGIRAVAATRFLADGRDQDAIALAWDNFTEYPSTATYTFLRECAGVRWEEWHERAHEWMRDEEQAKRGAAQPPTTAVGQPIGALRLSVLIEDGKLDEAWQLAEDGFAPPYLLTRLADRLTVHAPERAAKLYRVLAPLLIERSIGEDYRSAIETVEKLERVMPEADFRIFVEFLHENFGAHRVFIAALESRWLRDQT